MNERYRGPIEPGMVMVAPGGDGEDNRRDLVLGRHPFKPDMLILEALPCKMRARSVSIGEIFLSPEVNVRVVSRPEAPPLDAATAEVLVVCTFCGNTLDPWRESTFRHIDGGWAHKRDAGGTNHVKLPVWGQTWACQGCLNKLEDGIDPAAQGGLF